MGQRRETGITPRGVGIQIDFRWKGIRCREMLKLEPTKANLQYASRLRAEILRHIALDTFKYSDYFPESERAKIGQVTLPTFAKAAETWMKGNTGLEKSTISTYEKHLNKHWLPVFGETRIDKITYSDIRAHLADIELSAKTKNNIIIPIRRIMDAAFVDGHIQTNPAGRIRNTKVQKTLPDPFTIEEVNQILALLGERYHEQVRNYFEFAFFTGMRTAELIELQWGDVEENLVVVQRSRVEGQAKGTKTKTVRNIELNERAKAAITRQMKHTKLLGGHVFMNPNSNAAWGDQRAQANSFWKPTLAALKLHYRKPYQTRHTFATIMLMAGANPMWVARQMGHATMKMTLEVYSKWIDMADKSREIDRVNNALFGKTDGLAVVSK